MPSKRLMWAKLGPGHEVIPCAGEDFFSWAYEHVEKESGERIVGVFEEGDIIVSTVFLAINLSRGSDEPLWFETMVFGGILDGEQTRYATWEQAESGHAAMVARVIAGMPGVKDVGLKGR